MLVPPEVSCTWSLRMECGTIGDSDKCTVLFLVDRTGLLSLVDSRVRYFLFPVPRKSRQLDRSGSRPIGQFVDNHDEQGRLFQRKFVFDHHQKQLGESEISMNFVQNRKFLVLLLPHFQSILCTRHVGSVV